MKLMTAGEVKRRLGEGEDAVLLSLEHWLQIAQCLKERRELPMGAYGARVCPLCVEYGGASETYLHLNCEACPLYQVKGKSCCEKGECYGVFENNPTYDNALGIVAALARCKPVEAEPPEQQFYVWREGEPPQGKVGLRLIKWPDNPAIMLAIVDKDGKMMHAGRLLRIYQDGSQYRHVNVNPESGLDLDSDGRLRIKQEARCES